MGSGNPSDYVSVKGTEDPGYWVPANEFVAEHPAVTDTTPLTQEVHTGELETADLDDNEVAWQFRELGYNCGDILTYAPDESRKREACDAIVETVVRLQNPDYATDQVEVHGAAQRLSRQFEIEKAQLLYEGVDANTLELLDNPADILIHDFQAYVDQRYDLKEMREHAVLTLVPLIDPRRSDEFMALEGVAIMAPETVTPTRATRRALGSVASLLTLKRNAA